MDIEKRCEKCGEKFIAFTLHQKISWQRFCDKCLERKARECSRRRYLEKKRMEATA